MPQSCSVMDMVMDMDMDMDMDMVMDVDMDGMPLLYDFIKKANMNRSNLEFLILQLSSHLLYGLL